VSILLPVPHISPRLVNHEQTGNLGMGKEEEEKEKNTNNNNNNKDVARFKTL
jgi:hypothetical protein